MSISLLQKEKLIFTDSVGPVGGVPAPAIPNEAGVSCSLLLARFRRLKC